MVILPETSINKLYVFDFDDTIVSSTARIVVTKKNGRKVKLKASAARKYNLDDGDIVDDSQFECSPPKAKLIPHVILKVLNLMHYPYDHEILILTARKNNKPVTELLQSFNLESIPVHAIGDFKAEAKAKFVDELLHKKTYHALHLYEDSLSNIKAIRNVCRKHKIPFYGTLVDVDYEYLL